MMKRFSLILLCVAALSSLTGCEYLGQLLDLADDIGNALGNTYVDKWANLVNETQYDVKVDGPTLTYGSHTYTIVTDLDVSTTEFTKATAFVTFTNIPSGYTEFSAVYNNLLGKSLAGTVAMVPMAMEIYARDAATGEKCIKLLCTEGVAGEMITELKRKIVPSTASTDGDSYLQRYIPAALLKDAAPTNAYTPSSPYTVQMTMTSNGVKHSDQAGGDVTYACIVTSGGWSSAQRGVDVFLHTGTSQYKIYGCPGCYSQCATISGTWKGLN